MIATVDRAELLYLGACLLGGLAHPRARIAPRPFRDGTTPAAVDRLGHVLGAAPFTVVYLMPVWTDYVPPVASQVTVVALGLVPLAFASAIVRYRLMDVEVIIKRGLVYAAAVAAIAVIYAVLLRAASAVFFGGSQQHNSVIAMLATLVVVLLARPVKNAIQTTLDRAYYRDRYDYRRALVAFARDLNSDLDLQRLSERLVARVTETLVVDRMALMLGQLGRRFGRIHDHSRGGVRPVDAPPPPLSRASGVGGRLAAGHTVRARRSACGATLHRGRDLVLARQRHPLLRAVRLQRRHDRRDGTRPQRAAASRSTARIWHCSRRWRPRSPRRSKTAGSTGSCG